MIYLLKDEDGDIYAALANISEDQLQSSDIEVERALDVVTNGHNARDCASIFYDKAAERLGLEDAHDGYEGKAHLMTALLVKRGATAVDVRVWRCGA